MQVQRPALILAFVVVLTGSAVAYAVAGPGSEPKGEGFPDPVPPPPALEHYDKGEAIILESGSPRHRPRRLRSPRARKSARWTAS